LCHHHHRHVINRKNIFRNSNTRTCSKRRQESTSPYMHFYSTKSKPLSNHLNLILNRIKACQWDFFAKIKYELSTIIWFVGIGYSLRVRQLLTSDSTCRSRKLAICVRYGKWCQRFFCHQLAFAICEFCLNNLLDGHNVKFLLFPYFLFLVFIRDFIICMLFPESQLQTTAIDYVIN